MTGDNPDQRTLPQICDVFVLGGGPAGSTAAALLAERGRDVVIVEKDRHPRFHIGESLLPLNLPLFEKLGLEDQIRAIGITKYGAELVSPQHGAPVTLRLWFRLGQVSSLRLSGAPLPVRPDPVRQLRRKRRPGISAMPRNARGHPRGRRARARTRRDRCAARVGVEVLRRRVRPRHLSRQSARDQAPQPQAQQRCAVRPFLGREAATGTGRGQHQHLLVRARLVLVHPAARRDHQRRRGVLAAVPEVAPHRSDHLLPGHHRPVPGARASGCATRS